MGIGGVGGVGGVGHTPYGGIRLGGLVGTAGGSGYGHSSRIGIAFQNSLWVGEKHWISIRPQTQCQNEREVIVLSQKFNFAQRGRPLYIAMGIV